MSNPYKIVSDFEEMIAEFSGSKYAISVESCTAALFLSLVYTDVKGKPIFIPSRTYPGVACSIIHAGGKVVFSDATWKGVYKLYPFNITDGALRFKRGMYAGGLHCLSMHVKKLIPIGRGGMILTDDEIARDWLRKARFDGRNPVPLQDDHFDMIGWNMYLEPSQAARGIQLFQAMISQYPDGVEDLDVEKQKYADLSKFPIYGENKLLW